MLISAMQVHPEGNYEQILLEDSWENLNVNIFSDKKIVMGGKQRERDGGKRGRNSFQDYIQSS